MTPVVEPSSRRPPDHRAVPLLAEHDLGHYPQFRRYLAEAFALDADPLGEPGLVSVGDRFYELVFVGRSGLAFPAGVEINALVPGLEPLDERAADLDLWALLGWILDGVGGGWSADALARTGRIYRVPAAGERPAVVKLDM